MDKILIILIGLDLFDRRKLDIFFAKQTKSEKGFDVFLM